MKKIGEIDTKLTEEIKAWATDNLWICPECSSEETQYTIKIIFSGRQYPYSKWNIQIKETCVKCGRFRRFAPQSSILIKRFNNRFSTIVLPATGRDFYE